MLQPGMVFDIGDHSVEILANPETLDDRYLARVRADPGGPGIRGDFPHSHPTIVETFKCVSGSMKARIGRDVLDVAVGEKVEVPIGQVHGFENTGLDELVVDSEVIFPGGYHERLDLMHFAAIYDRLKREKPVNAKTGEPPMLQMAVLTHAWRDVIRQPGIAGILMPVLAVAGRMAGYRSRPFDDDPPTHKV